MSGCFPSCPFGAQQRSAPRSCAAPAQRGRVRRRALTLPFPWQTSSSHKATDRRISKKFKYDKGHLVKSELQKLVPKTDGAAAPEAPPETARDNAGPLLPGRAAGAPAPAQAAGGPASAASPAPPEEGPAAPEHGAPPGGESAGGVAAPEEPPQGPARAAPPQMDSSVFLDDDSNQPMPVSRFFGNVELMQVRLAVPFLLRCPQQAARPGDRM